MDAVRTVAAALQPDSPDKLYIDLAWHGLLFGPLLFFSIKRYARPSGVRRTEARGMSYPLLMVHIVLGTFLVARYLAGLWRTRSDSGAPTGPVAQLPDVLAGIVNAGCSWMLARNRVPGVPSVSRTAFQSLSVVVALLAVAAGMAANLTTVAGPAGGTQMATVAARSALGEMVFTLAGPHAAVAAYRALVHSHSAFFFARFFTFFITKTHMRTNFNEAFSLAVFTGFLLAAVESAGWLGGMLMLGVMALLNIAEEWVSARITPENATEPLPRLALLIGMVEQGTYALLEDAEHAAKKHD